jgi:hypothetical protein
MANNIPAQEEMSRLALLLGFSDAFLDPRGPPNGKGHWFVVRSDSTMDLIIAEDFEKVLQEALP